MKQNNEEYEDSLPEGAPEDKKPKKPEDTPESRLDALEKNVDVMKDGMGKILKLLTDKKAQEEVKPEDKKPEDKEPEDKEPGEEDKSKQDGIGTKPVNPNPEGGDAPLPKAPAGETDETGKPEGDKGPKVVEKDIQKAVQKVLKEMGVTKSVTPRSRHEEIIKQNSAKKDEFAMDILKRAKEGKLTVADMNRETKEFVKKKYDDGLQQIMDLEVGE